ncbi:2-dehydropantoate 2-reductase [Shewanella sp. NIFS-20-20]|uniref:2-dehydropantoate 2-reductase n=1 Tax=Shewanella sp. NIFS-20-20 TaxID=2853806 RepID=UPI001C464A92|nr:2-dehydropantoate 2-reductase [Shewanella sp. NIFS-20-20]MBV7315907.1 2-dehydropantoate 2-reductase [Shewanella sp. NIFS-20-20]
MSAQAANIAILGAGAIGQLWHHQLAHAGIASVLLWRDLAATIPRHLTVIKLDGLTSQSPHQGLSVEGLTREQLQEIQLLIVTVKAHQVVTALTPFMPLLPLDCHILLLHNGLGPHLAVDAMLAGRGLLLGTTSQAALRVSRDTIKHTGQGVTHWGQFRPPVFSSSLRAEVERAIDDCHWQSDIIGALWQKLAVNAVINPLTALNNCTNGELAKPEYAAQILTIINEFIAVAAAEGIALNPQQLLARVTQVITLTSANYSSMHQDVYHGRATEIDAINGYLVSRAATHGIRVPLNQELVAAILQRAQP